MISFEAIIEKEQSQKDRMGWTYIVIPKDIAIQLHHGVKGPYRIKGNIGGFDARHVSLLHLKGGGLFLPLNAAMRRVIQKEPGEKIILVIELETEEPPLSPHLLESLELEPEAQQFFQTLTKGHQRYFSTWVESAKTIETRSNRIYQALEALQLKLDYPAMIRRNKKNSKEL